MAEREEEEADFEDEEAEDADGEDEEPEGLADREDEDAEEGAEEEGEPEAEAEAELPGAGTPAGAELREAQAAFDRGDYVRVRAIAGKLVETSDDEVARYARDLLGRTQIDPVQVGVVLACLALFAYIVYTYVL